jgi:hypothetical protein
MGAGMSEERNVIRLGVPGPLHFAWEFTAPHIPSTDFILVYADTTMEAIDAFRAAYPAEVRFEIRWMGDNE